MDKFRDTADEYYKELQAGRAEHKDFERYIYGQFGSKSMYKDERDETVDRAHIEKKRIEH